ncbi:MAG: GNAT family N-acetyltransferase [Candidatus Micrarchaeia archaeon]
MTNILHDEKDCRFYIDKEGAELLYGIREGVMYIYHVYVPKELRDHGIAEQLADAAFEFAIKNNMKVKPECSYIKYYLSKHVEMQKYESQN